MADRLLQSHFSATGARASFSLTLIIVLVILAGCFVLQGCSRPAPLADVAPNLERSGAALINAAQAGDWATVNALLKSGVDPNSVVNTNTALTFAARDGQLKIAQTLIAQGAEVDWIDREGVTPLILASFKGHVELVKLLLSQGADTTIHDQWNRTALDYAVRRGEDDEIAQLLRTARSRQLGQLERRRSIPIP